MAISASFIPIAWSFLDEIRSLPQRNFAVELLQKLAKEFREAAKRGGELGLSESELAFYDALADNDSAVQELGDETLKKIAHELTEKLRNSTWVDWQKRESVRARLRNLVRITLRRYKYPPDQQEAAIKLVLDQAERLTDEGVVL